MNFERIKANIAVGSTVGFSSLVIIFGLFFLSSWIFMLIWNAILPSLFNFPIITFWQAAGLKFLLNGVGSWKQTQTKKENV